MDEVPELASRLDVDAGGRLVEQQQLRFVQHAGGEREALLPAAGKLAGELIAAVAEAHALDHLGHRGAAVGHFEHRRDEVEILERRQVVVEAEALRHVADLATDVVRLAEDVVAEAGPRAAVGREQAAQHADRRRLAAPLAPRKPQISPRATCRVKPSTTLRSPKLLRRSRTSMTRSFMATAACGFTVTGWPGLNSVASSGFGRASARKTNLARVDSE